MAVSVDVQNDIALVTMDDGKANAVNFELMAALNAALDEAEAKGKVIVLTGREGRFSGGFDLKALPTFSPEDVGRLLDEGGKLIARLYGGPLPLVVACTGHAIAMGALLALTGDTRVGAHGDFKIGLNETANGMKLPVFGIEIARDRLHSDHQTQAIVQSYIYDSSGAVEAGYLDRLAPADKVVEYALGVAKALVPLSGPAYLYHKLALRKSTLDLIKASIGNQGGL